MLSSSSRLQSGGARNSTAKSVISTNGLWRITRGCWAIFSLLQLVQTTSALPPLIPITFGNGLAGFPICNTPTIILSYTITSPVSSYGVLSHFWVTGDVELDDGILVDYFIDNETDPSISFQPALACGQGFPQEMSEDPVSTGGVFAAGASFGKGAPVGAWYSYRKIPFFQTVIVSTRSILPGRCLNAYMNVRGSEVGSSEDVRGIILPSGFEVPIRAKLHLQSMISQTLPPLWFASVLNVSYGYSGILLDTTFVVSTSPPANNYIEGCWHLHTNGNVTFPGMIIGTGVEDFFDSSYWFGAASGYPNGVLFQQPSSGLLHFSRGSPFGTDGVEQISAYRSFSQEVVGFQNGGRLVWRVGDQDGKCFRNTTQNPIGTPSAVTLTTYAWVYTWPNGEAISPIPDLPQNPMSYTCSSSSGTCVPVTDFSGQYWNSDCNKECTPTPPPPIPSPIPGPPAQIGCSDGQCDAFCNSTSVHGCAVSWTGTMSLRAPPTGTACGNKLGVLCPSPADACAAGWTICLNQTSASSGTPFFRAGLTAEECAAQDPRRFVAAMQHANPAWSNLPPAPCPVAPVDTDNGCNANGWGAEAVCCGFNCSVPSCPNTVWVDATRIHIGENEGCGAVSSQWIDGILCCKEQG